MAKNNVWRLAVWPAWRDLAQRLAGGVSAKDARALAEDMHCEPHFLQSMRKGREQTEFACFVRNFTPQTMRTLVPLGYMNDLPRLDEDSYGKLIASNRAAFCAPIHEVTRLLEKPIEPHESAKSPSDASSGTPRSSQPEPTEKTPLQPPQSAARE